MKILITGNQGFIGSHAQWELRFQGHEVMGYDRGYNLSEESQKPDVIVHCAANLHQHFEENIAHTFNLAHLFGESSPHFIFLSSAAVYGDTFGAKEDDALRPFGAYGLSKEIEEGILSKVFPKLTIFRLANVYGYASNHGVISRFLSDPMSTVSFPGHSRDFVRVDDVVSAISLSISEPEKWLGTFNISTGKRITIEDLWKKIYPGEMMTVEEEKGQVKEIAVSVLNNEKAKANGWEPKHTL